MRKMPWLSAPSRWALAQLAASTAATSAEVPWRRKIWVSRACSSAQETSEVPALWGMCGVGAGMCICYVLYSCLRLFIKRYSLF